MITIAQAVASLIAAPRPVLFLDTCALLDIVRAPLRDRAETVRAGVELRNLAASGTVRLIIQDIVPREWDDNLPSVRKAGEEGIRAFTATWQIATDLGLPAPPLPVLPPGAMIDDLVQLSRDLFSATEILDRDHAGMSWAIGQVSAKRKPSVKNAVKDCHILGHALTLSFHLEIANYPRSRILVSSNTSDFAAQPATMFHPDIAPDATAAGLRYANSLEAAVADLRAGGEVP